MMLMSPANYANYMLSLLYVAEKYGISLCTWSPMFQKAHLSTILLVRKLLKSRNEETSDCIIDTTMMNENIVAQEILNRHLPTLDNYEFDEIIELRRKRKDELEAFKVGVAEAVAKIEVSKNILDVWEQVQSIISRDVDPAILNLKASLKNQRLDTISKTYRATSKMIRNSFTISISYYLGCPLELVAILSILGLLKHIGPMFIDDIVEREKILNGSRWSLLVK